MFRFWVAALVALALAGMACGDDAAVPEPTPTVAAAPTASPAADDPPARDAVGDSPPIVDDASRVAAERAAESAQIVLADFPAGWRGEPQYDSPEVDDIPVYGDSLDVTLNLGGAFGLSEECLEWSLRTASSPGSLVERSSDQFDRDGDENVSSDAGVYATVALASAAADAHVALFPTCGDQMEALMEAIPDAEYGDGSTSATLAVLPPIAGTSWSHSFRMTIEIPSIGSTIVLEYHALRQGRIMAGIGWTNANGAFDAALAERLVATLSDRTRAADAALIE